MSHNKAFTLIELLIVVAIIAVLAIVVVLVLNPGQLLMQSRDSNRLSDLANIQTAMNLYLADAGSNGTANIGSPATVYVSIPDRRPRARPATSAKGSDSPRSPQRMPTTARRLQRGDP